MVECKFTLSDAQMRIRGLYDVVNDYRGMCDAHCVDYITEDHWNMLVPHEWQDDLLHIGGSDDWISYFLHPNKLLHPCLIKEFLIRINHLKLLDRNKEPAIPPYDEYDASNIDHFGMSRKKAHEVSNMTGCIQRLSSLMNITQIIDVGSGKGYLSKSLTYNCQVKVFGVDSQSINTSGALDRCRKLDKYFDLQLQKKKETMNESQSSTKCNNRSLTADEWNTYQPLTCIVSPHDNITDIIKATVDGFSCTNNTTGIIGLHTCGQLPNVIMNQFMTNEALKVLCLVGCCYHQITDGFPMSNYMKGNDAYLNRNSLMLACQNEACFNEVTSGNALTSIFYRSILQVILCNELKFALKDRNIKDLNVGRIKKYMNFIDYARQALNNINLSHVVISDETLNEYYINHQCHLVKLQRFLQIRVLLGGVVESLILMDRLLYMLELKDQCRIKDVWLEQIFSPSVSPRCIALCAYKMI